MAKIWEETGSYAELLLTVPHSDRIPPLLPFLIKSIAANAGVSAETAGLAINIVLGSLVSLVGFGIAFETTKNKKIAIITALFLAVHPSINDLSKEIQRDAPYLFFSGCAIWFAAIGLLRKKNLFWCWTGVALAFAFLLRYETAEFLLLIPAIVFAFSLGRRISWKQAVLYVSTLFVCTGIVFCSMLLLMGTQEVFTSYCKDINFRLSHVERLVFDQSGKIKK